MRKLRDFKCIVCEEISEALVNDDVEEIECRQEGCCGIAIKQLSAPIGNGGCAHGFLKRVAGFNQR